MRKGLFFVILLLLAVVLLVIPVSSLTIPPGVGCWTLTAQQAGGTETQILSLTTYDDGTGIGVFGGTAPNGRLYKMNATTNGWLLVAARAGGTETDILSLTTYDDGTGTGVFGGTFPNGRLYKMNATTNGWLLVAGQAGGTETSIRSLTTYDDGTGTAVFGGTGPNGRLYKYNYSNTGPITGGWQLVAAQAGGTEIIIYSLTTYDDGTGTGVFGGTFPNGRLYKYNYSNLGPITGGWQLVAARAGGTETHILSLTTYNDGTGTGVFGGTAPNGRLYKYNYSNLGPITGGWQLVAAQAGGTETNIASLTTYNDGTGTGVFGGTGPNGRLYKYNYSNTGPITGGWQLVAAQAGGTETYILSLTTYDDGTGTGVFGGTFPNGRLYKYIKTMVGSAYPNPPSIYTTAMQPFNYTVYASNISANISYVIFNLTYWTRDIQVDNVFINETSQVSELVATIDNSTQQGFCQVNVTNASALMRFDGQTMYPIANILFKYVNTTAFHFTQINMSYPWNTTWAGNPSEPMEGGEHWFNLTAGGLVYPANMSRMDINLTRGYNLTVYVRDASSHALIPNSQIILSGTTTGTQTSTTGIFNVSAPYGLLIIDAVATDYYGSQKVVLVDHDQTTTIYLRVQYQPVPILQDYPHYVTFRTKTYTNKGIPVVNVSAQGFMTSTGNYDWLVRWLGLPLEEAPLNNTHMSATTDDFGAVTFLMIPTVKYNVSFSHPDYAFTNLVLMPQDTEYIIYAEETGTPLFYPITGISELEAVNISVTHRPYTASVEFLNVTYNDTFLHTTGGYIDVLMKNETPFGAPVWVVRWPVPAPPDNQSSWTNGTEITHIIQVSGYVNARVEHSDYGFINRSFPFAFNSIPVSFLGFGEGIALLVAFGIMLLTTMLGGASHARQIAFVTCIEGWFFYSMHWFNALYPRLGGAEQGEVIVFMSLTLATVIAVVANFEQRKRREKY